MVFSAIHFDYGETMKEFWKENGKIICKLLLNQFGATFFGLMLITASTAVDMEGAWLMLIASCFATLFYMYLIYNVLWERGGQDRIKIDGGRAIRKPLTGLKIILFANIPNIIIAIIILISNPFAATHEWAGSMNVIGRAAALLWEGMYSGIVAYFSPHNPIIHLLDIFPALFMGTVAYYFGLNNFRILALFDGKRPPKK